MCTAYTHFAHVSLFDNIMYQLLQCAVAGRKAMKHIEINEERNLLSVTNLTDLTHKYKFIEKPLWMQIENEMKMKMKMNECSSC